MKLKKIAALVAIAAASGSAFATDGYFAHGYGMKAKGMGGAATAMASDSFGGANNPASMVWAGDRLDVGLDFFSPKRTISRSGGTAGIDFQAESGSNMHYVPEFGYNKMLGWDMSLGVTVYGNGGMNTDFPGGQISTAPGSTVTCPGFNGMAGAVAVGAPFNALCGSGRLGIDMMQLVVAPTFAMKVNKTNSLGVALLLTHQQFKASGLHGFGGYTATATTGGPSNLTNLGRDKSNGVGLRFGWMGQLSDTVTMGAAYATKTRMSKFDLYKDLFAERGGFDLPENWNIGLAFKPNDQWTIAADFQRINYGDINSVGNPSTNGGLTIGPGAPGPFAAAGGTLGCDSCRGFGWSNVDVIKLGFEYKYSNALTLRAGYNHTDNPISSRDVTFNMLAPGVVQDHVTLGFTYNVTKDSELTMAYMHAFKKSVSGTSLFNQWTTAFGMGTAGTDKIEMSQNSLGIAYGLKF
ncbi:MAG: outer membrane protein transport protein [Rhodocyclales bacterium]|nr:outer membrane protein transport protein [Rhodocyclales bacterium]